MISRPILGTCSPCPLIRIYPRRTHGTTRRSEDLRGDLDQVVILGAKAVSCRNGYPVPLNVEFVDGDSQSSYTSFRGNHRDVHRVHVTVPANTSCGNVNQPINLTSPFVHSNYLSKYHGLVSEEALRTTGILRSSTGMTAVSLEHPVMGIIQANKDVLQFEDRQVQQLRSIPDRNGNDVEVAYVDNELAEMCLDLLASDLQQHMPIFNIKGLRMKVSRAGVPDAQFADTNGLEFEPSIAGLSELNNSDGTPRYTQVNTHRSFDLVCNITYAFLSGGPEDEDGI